MAAHTVTAGSGFVTQRIPDGHTLRERVLPFSMRFLPLSVCALLFALPAKADKYWLSDPAGEKNAAAGSSPNVIEGVLLAEDKDGYHLRIVGGEMLLLKKSVFKVEKDDLTLAAIVKAEQDLADKQAAANREREQEQTASRKLRDIQVLEASMRRSRGDVIDAQAQVSAPVPQPYFDPVVGVARGGLGPQQDLMVDAQIAWQMTRDPRYLKVLRQLRRLR